MWLTWRQHRAETLSAVAAIAVIAGALIAIGLPMHTTFNDDIAPCLAGGGDRELCSANLALFDKYYGGIAGALPLFGALPFVIGALLGAPLLAREFETGTWQLAWTQAVPRMRWLAVKLGALAATTVALTAALAAVVTWFRGPLDQLYGRFDVTSFDIEGLVPVAYALFAFAGAALAGAVFRRSIPALAAILAVFVAVRVTVETVLRPRYRSPLSLVENIDPTQHGLPIGTGNRADWSIGEGLLQAGQRLGPDAFNTFADAADAADVSTTTYMHDHGVQRWVEYHPADRFWAFQYVEAAIYLGLSVILLAVVVWRVRRRLG